MFRYTRGSSPLTRGKRDDDGDPREQHRLIPAHAGKTSTSSRRRGLRPAHPRSRGENVMDPPSIALASGSSPLTRGKPQGPRGDRRGHRLIPAHAGKTQPQAARRNPGRAHPRSRGENDCGGVIPVVGVGSSPLTRGKPHAPTVTAPTGGLIPAHAGKTMRVTVWVPLGAAHPRSRGENLFALVIGVRTFGSSPLTRGKPLSGRRRVPPRRLIPAHAGKTRRHRNGRGHREAHPRSRGENDSGGETRP